jgi:hypothetical protein
LNEPILLRIVIGALLLCACPSPVGGAAAVLKHSGAPGFPASSSLISHLAGLRKPPSPLRSSISNQRLSIFQQWLRDRPQPCSPFLLGYAPFLTGLFILQSHVFTSSHSLIRLSTSLLDQSNSRSLSYSRHSFSFDLPALARLEPPFDLNGHLDIACSFMPIPARLTVDDHLRMSAQPRL